jgi:hypothetical protein
MKKGIAFTVVILSGLNAFTQNVGIGTTAPKARLHLTDSSVVFSAADPLLAVPGNPPLSGAGARMMWYSGKAAFRTGFIDAAQWNKDNIGHFSFASGYSTVANNSYATAMGRNTTASGTAATALGYFTVASGSNSTSFGSYNQATGSEATAMNSNTIASGFASTAMGFATIAKADFSAALGSYTKSRSPGSLVIGLYNDTTNTNRLFEIGNGIAENARANALTVLVNGNMGLGTTVPNAKLHVQNGSVLFTGPEPVPPSTLIDPPASFNGTRMMWYPEKGAFRVGTVSWANWNKDSIGNNSIAGGYDTKAKGIASTSLGYETIASDFASISMGNGSVASGQVSTSMGYYTKSLELACTSMGQSTTASGYTSTSMGWGTIASGSFSTTMGGNTRASGGFSLAAGSSTYAKAIASFSVGMYNDTSDIPNINNPGTTDRVFQIGNGNSTTRSNALTILRNGNIGVGTTNPTRPLSFPPFLGEKILLYPGGTGEVGIGVYGNELRIHTDYAAAKISFGYQDNAGVFTEKMWLNNTSGVLTVNGTAYPSDQRFKKQISNIQQPLQKILTLNGVEYYMRTDEFPEMKFTHDKQVGLLAQEVENVLPEAVHLINADGYKAVDYAKLVPLLIEGIKAQQQQIDELKKLLQEHLKK